MRILILILALCFIACKEQSPQGTTTVKGSAVIIDPVTGQPDWQSDLSGTKVSIEGTALSTLTSDDGRFAIENVPQGSHTFIYDREGYGKQTVFDYDAEFEAPQLAYLYPLGDYLAEIRDVSILDTTITRVEKVGVIVGSGGDTLDRGHDTTVTIHDANYVIRITGDLHLPVRQRFAEPNLYLFFSTGNTIRASDPESWDVMWSSDYHRDRMIVSGSTFTIYVYEQEQGYLNDHFTKGEKIHCAVYALPGFYGMNGLLGKTAHIKHSNTTFFPTLVNVNAPPVPLIYPW